jgi:hypothetical protein
MALSVIGSGFGRTGTRSLKDALEQLGFAPCHHMEEVFQNPPQVAHWQAIVAGEPVHWEDVFTGYRAQVDWPGCHVWRELASAFPEAKVVHSMRPDDAWWSSFSHTIGKLMTHYRSLEMPPHLRDMMGAMEEAIGARTFGGDWTTRETALAAYHKRAEDVRAAIPPERLLVFDVAQGWGPLCAFLEVREPATPFPNRNSRAEFWQGLGGEPA